MSQSRFRRPPAALRTARLDNLAVVPASLLPFKKQWQQRANELLQGSTLIILPSAAKPQRKTYEHVAAQLRGKGKSVMIVPAERVH